MTRWQDRVVAVFGSSDPREGQAGYELARAVGRKLAACGYVIVNGGYGGTMEASARGAQEAGGVAIGVTCSIWRDRANPYIDRSVQTADLWERVATLLDLGTAGYVALPGATGTLLELVAAWELTCKHLCTRRPLVCVGEFWRPLVGMMASVRPGCKAYVSVIDEVEELERFFGAAKVR